MEGTVTLRSATRNSAQLRNLTPLTFVATRPSSAGRVVPRRTGKWHDRCVRRPRGLGPAPRPLAADGSLSFTVLRGSRCGVWRLDRRRRGCGHRQRKWQYHRRRRPGLGRRRVTGAVVGNELDTIREENQAMIDQRMAQRTAGATTMQDVINMTRAGLSDRGDYQSHPHAWRGAAAHNRRLDRPEERRGQ